MQSASESGAQFISRRGSGVGPGGRSCCCCYVIVVLSNVGVLKPRGTADSKSKRLLTCSWCWSERVPCFSYLLRCV